MEYVFYLTNACNLRCKYCYEKNKKNNHMNFSIIEKLLNERKKSTDKSTTVSFFGGEPLLEKQLIYKTVKMCKDITKNTKHKFEFSLTTNGTLIDDEFIKFCKKNNITVGISIDGTESIHNLNRVDKTGKGSFQAIINNSKKCIAAKLSCMALPVVTLNNVTALSESVKFLIDVGFKNITCNFNYSDNWDVSTLNVLKREYIKIADIYYNEFKNKNYIKIYPLDTKIQLHVNERKCSDSCNVNRIVVDTDGKLYPCIQYVGNNEFVIGDYENGVDDKKRRTLILKRLNSKVVCEECNLKDRCIYKCGCARIMTTQNITEVSPIVCETERIYIETADALAARLYNDFKRKFILLKYNNNK